jgi:hypothetical protein
MRGPSELSCSYLYFRYLVWSWHSVICTLYTSEGEFTLLIPSICSKLTLAERCGTPYTVHTALAFLIQSLRIQSLHTHLYSDLSWSLLFLHSKTTRHHITDLYISAHCIFTSLSSLSNWGSMFIIIHILTHLVVFTCLTGTDRVVLYPTKYWFNNTYTCSLVVLTPLNIHCRAASRLGRLWFICD